MPQTIYDFTAKKINGQEASLSEYQGKVVLVVNVASLCGFTPQYTGLEELYQKYKDRGFVILGFPCNQFGDQEPGGDAEIKNFCENRFKITFPLFSKVDVNGPQAHPLFEFIKKEKRGFLGTTKIKWNFTKFLVDRKGNVIQRFGSVVKPDAIGKSIEKLL